MAHARGLMGAVLLVGRLAWAENDCADDEPPLGARVANRAGQFVVADVTADSPAAAAALRSGDVVVQVNATIVRTCRDWSGALKEAARGRKAVLLLVERDGAPVALVVTAAARRVEAPEPVVAAQPAFEPAPPPPPPPLPETVTVSVDGIRQDLARLAPADHLPTSLLDYRRAVGQTRRAIATLAVRQAAPTESVNALRIALRPFEAAEVAWEALDGGRTQDRRSRNLPVAEELTAPYFDDSPAAAVLDEFPFLASTVASRPEPGLVQTAGRWRPVQARQLLWEHGRAQLGALPGGAPR